MGNLTYAQIKTIERHTPQELKGTQPYIKEYLGYFMPKGANWAYHAGYTEDNILVVTRFGEVM